MTTDQRRAAELLCSIVDQYEEDCGRLGVIIDWAAWFKVGGLVRISEQDCINARGELRATTPAQAVPDGWQDISTAPKDGTMLILWVEAIDKEDSCHPTENAMAWRTIGFNNLDHDGDDIWKFSGWCWQHDHFVEGDGTPTKWMPMPPPADPSISLLAEERK